MRIGQGFDIHRFSEDPAAPTRAGRGHDRRGPRPRRAQRRRRGRACPGGCRAGRGGARGHRDALPRHRPRIRRGRQHRAPGPGGRHGARRRAGAGERGLHGARRGAPARSPRRGDVRRARPHPRRPGLGEGDRVPRASGRSAMPRGSPALPSCSSSRSGRDAAPGRRPEPAPARPQHGGPAAPAACTPWVATRSRVAAPSSSSWPQASGGSGGSRSPTAKIPPPSSTRSSIWRPRGGCPSKPSPVPASTRWPRRSPPRA